jgi:internalin A
MTNDKVMQLIREAREKNFTFLDLSNNQFTHLPPEIGKLKNLTKLDLSYNQLIQFPSEIEELENLEELCLYKNRLTHLPPDIGKLKNLTKLDLSHNQLIQLPSEVEELINLKELYLYKNQLTYLPPEIGEFKNLESLLLFNNLLTKLPPEFCKLKALTTLYLSENELTHLPPEIGELKNLETLYLYNNRLTQLPTEIGELKNLTIFELYNNQLTQLPSEIGELKNLSRLYLYKNQLTKLPPEIGELKNLTVLDLSHNQLIHLPSEIEELENLAVLDLSNNQFTHLPPEIGKLENLSKLDLSHNPLTSPPPEIVSRGLGAIFTYLKQSRTTENNEAKLILVGDPRVGKTCLAHRLITNKFLGASTVTEGINVSKWKIPSPGSIKSEIKLNIWDFGGQEIYHATHQFFLTKRSVYLLLWNARKTEKKDYNFIYYWLYTIEAFGEDSPIILVMSKMNKGNDYLNQEKLKERFPQIVDYIKIDSSDGKGISNLSETISRTAWNLPLMRAKWVDSWFKVRQKLEVIGGNWISYDKFEEICISEGLETENIIILDGYLHDLGVTLHFKDKLTLKNIVILNPEWVTEAFYKILSSINVLDNEGVLSISELNQIWDKETYPSSVHPSLMDLMNKFELSYELPDKSSYLVPELLPEEESSTLEWKKEKEICFTYCYDYFLPPGIIPRLIVRMHQMIKKKENGMPLCWRKGLVLNLQNSCALVKVKPIERQIEIRVKGDNKRGAMGAICSELDQINSSMKKIKITKQIPCNCSEICSEMYSYNKLLDAERNNVKTIQCHNSFKPISVSLLLNGYIRQKERFRNLFEYDVFICHSSKDMPIIESLITEFKKENIKYWIDKEQIEFGDPVIQKIQDGLQKSRYVVPCLSKNLNSSGWTKAEYSAILNVDRTYALGYKISSNKPTTFQNQILKYDA